VNFLKKSNTFRPRTLPVPGMDAKNIFFLRDPADANNINTSYEGKRIVVVGSSFIGMEVAANIVKKAKSVVVIGMEKVPFERVLGEQIGGALQKV
jgi:NAD(P)H-nitrite reductase large subunit